MYLLCRLLCARNVKREGNTQESGNIFETPGVQFCEKIPQNSDLLIYNIYEPKCHRRKISIPSSRRKKSRCNPTLISQSKSKTTQIPTATHMSLEKYGTSSILLGIYRAHQKVKRGNNLVEVGQAICHYRQWNLPPQGQGTLFCIWGQEKKSLHEEMIPVTTNSKGWGKGKYGDIVTCRFQAGKKLKMNRTLISKAQAGPTQIWSSLPACSNNLATRSSMKISTGMNKTSFKTSRQSNQCLNLSQTPQSQEKNSSESIPRRSDKISSQFESRFSRNLRSAICLPPWIGTYIWCKSLWARSAKLSPQSPPTCSKIPPRTKKNDCQISDIRS